MTMRINPTGKAAAVRFDRVLLTLTRPVANTPNRPAWYPESFFSTLDRFRVRSI